MRKHCRCNFDVRQGLVTCTCQNLAWFYQRNVSSGRWNVKVALLLSGNFKLVISCPCFCRMIHLLCHERWSQEFSGVTFFGCFYAIQTSQTNVYQDELSLKQYWNSWYFLRYHICESNHLSHISSLETHKVSETKISRIASWTFWGFFSVFFSDSVDILNT